MDEFYSKLIFSDSKKDFRTIIEMYPGILNHAHLIDFHEIFRIYDKNRRNEVTI